MSDPLRDLLGGLAGQQPVVDDWPGRVRQAVRERRRRQRALTGVVTVALLAIGGSAVVYAGGPPAAERLIGAPVPSTISSPAHPADDICEPMPPPARAVPIPSRAAEPGDRTNTVVVDLAANCTVIRVGQELLLRVGLTGDAALPRISAATIGGTTQTSLIDCAFPHPLAAPRVRTADSVLRHRYAEPGTDRIRVVADSGCTGYEGQGEAELSITVLPAAAPAEPSPTAEPTPVPRPTPTSTAGPSTAGAEGRPSSSAEPSYPPYGSQDIEIQAVAAEQAVVGQEWVLEVTVTGFAEKQPFLQEPRYDGDGPGWVVGACARPVSSSPPPARAQTVRRTFRHTFDTPGRHEVLLRAESGCSYYRGMDELLLTVDVAAAGPAPSPTA